MTDDEFLSFCNEHPDLSFETTAQGALIVLPETYSLTGARNSEITFQLHRWAPAGWACGSAIGFVTADRFRKQLTALLKSAAASADNQIWPPIPYLSPLPAPAHGRQIGSSAAATTSRGSSAPP